MILKRLFESLMENRVLVFLTSNRPPSDLYLNGLQRYLFLPFIDMLYDSADVLELETIDYRLLHAMGFDNYYHPIGPESEQAITEVWNKLTNNAVGGYEIASVPQGRSIGVSKAAKKTAEFTFKELCRVIRYSFIELK